MTGLPKNLCSIARFENKINTEFFYYSLHEISLDSLNLILTKYKNIRDVSQEKTENSPSWPPLVFRPAYIDY
jgi:hypothetical protein